MAKVTKSSGSGGMWLKKDELKNGDIMKLVSEAKDEEGQNGTQLVAKCRIKGQEGDAMNVAINKPSKNALIDAFGDDTKEWVGKLLTIQVEKGVFAGRRGIAMYLVPEGFELTEDEGGYLVILKIGGTTEKNTVADDVEIDPDDIPF